MNRDEMKDLLDQGVDPLDISIKKWEDIRDKTGSDIGTSNCALCKTYRNDKPKLDKMCGDCPVRSKTGRGECIDTPYSKWVHHHIDYHTTSSPRMVHCPECEKIAQKEINFLKSLKVQVTTDP